MDELTDNVTPPGKPLAKRLRLHFQAKQRLKGKTRIDQVYQTGKKAQHFPLALRSLRRDDSGPSRLAFSVSKRCGNAVARNAIRRRLREAYRLMQHDFPPGLDWLVVVKPHPQLLSLQAYQQRLRTMLMASP